MRGVNALPAAVRPPGRVGAPPFADVVAEHLDAVYRYLVYLTGDRAAAEDLAAETFERAFKSWRRFDPRRGAPRTWLCRIAHSAAVDCFRAEARRQRPNTVLGFMFNGATSILVDFTADVERPTSVAELNDAFREAASGPMKGILGVSDEPLVSTDFRGDARSSAIAD